MNTSQIGRTFYGTQQSVDRTYSNKMHSSYGNWNSGKPYHLRSIEDKNKPMTNQKARALVQQEYFMTRQDRGGAVSSQNILRSNLRGSRNDPET